MEYYFLAKALHLLAVISWFAGLLYLGRLFVYHAEALEGPPEAKVVLAPQFALMEKRLWRAITAPAAVAALGFGIWLMVMTKAWLLPWFHLKAALLLLLYAYHGFCGRLRRRLAGGGNTWSSKAYRVWNEVPTVLMFALVFVAVYKRPWGAVVGMIAVLALLILGMGVFTLARRRRAA